MLRKKLIILICYLKWFCVIAQDPSDIGLNPKELIRRYGYPLEVHQIHTEDGYILETHRIPHGLYKSNSTRRPVLLWPGVMCSSAVWISMGPQNSLGFILADKGFDVWLANYRGSTWSRKHETLNPDKDAKRFFDFSFQEIGYYDLPANIDYILNITNHEKLFYIGHSQGTTIFFAMGADRPEYNRKIETMSALAPVAYMSNLNIPFFDVLVPLLNFLQIFLEQLKLYELLPYNPIYNDLTIALCTEGSPLLPVCEIILKMISGPSSSFNTTLIPLITSNLPAGTSSRSFVHMIQQLKDKKFQHYDFGYIKNFMVYGQRTPPEYEVQKVTAPVALYYSSGDSATPIKDVEKLIATLPNVIHLGTSDSYNHFDYIWSSNSSAFYNNVINQMIINLD